MAAALVALASPVLAQGNLLAVTGNVKTPLSLSLDDLRALPQSPIKAALKTARGTLALDCTGPALSEVLNKAAPDFGPAHHALLSHTLLVTATDGFAVALSFGEIDPAFGKAVAVIATDCGGKKLDFPRLILGGDVEAGRAVSGLVKIDVK